MNESRLSPQARSEFIREWLRALRHTGYVPLPWAEQERILGPLTDRLADIVTGDPFDPALADEVGRDLVAAGFATPESLGRTVTVVSGLSALFDGIESKLVPVLEHLIIGSASAMYDRSLDGQEAVRIAALAAQAQAERALKASEERFRIFATHDELTGLPNRTRFAERIQAISAEASPTERVGVCCIDLDAFNNINDTLGYEVGDKLLKAAAKRLTLVGSTAAGVAFETFRLHSDEFVLLLVDIGSSEELHKAATLALSVLSEPFNIGEYELPVTACVGVSEARASSMDATELLRRGEIALHWAKLEGTGHARMFDSDRSAQDASKFQLTAAMPSALRKDEFTLAYQPLVNLTSGKMVGVEALARWRHPQRGVLQAGEFVQLAEDSGLILAIDDYLMKRACEQAAQWQESSKDPLYISVNLASRQLHRSGLVGMVSQVLSETGLEPKLLQLEITEHAVIDTDDQAIEALNDLLGLGVRIVIDDFGTGYSNLACLSKLPIQGLKLDAAFAKSLTGDNGVEDTRQRDFLSAVVQLGHLLDLDVIAEGIETPLQAQAMRDVGCDAGQGWLFGRPATARTIEVTRGRRILRATESSGAY